MLSFQVADGSIGGAIGCADFAAVCEGTRNASKKAMCGNCVTMHKVPDAKVDTAMDTVNRRKEGALSKSKQGVAFRRTRCSKP